jgi:O-antigen chain-terminating methyltransferase
MRYEEFEPDPDRLAQRILAEAALLAEAGAGAANPVADRALPTTLSGLIALRDREFVESAYRVVLGRPPDGAGLDHYLQALRGGRLDKIDIIGDLRYSREGRVRGVPLQGLGLRYAVRRAARLPLLDWFTRWLDAMRRVTGVVKDVDRHQRELEQLQAVTESHSAAIQALQDRTTRLDDMFRHLQFLESELQKMRVETSGHSENIAAANLRYERLSAANARLLHQMRALTLSASPATRAEQQDLHVSPAAASPQTFDLFYVEFEDRFRGPRERIKERQELYLDYLASAGAGSATAPVIDLGCGRGEWLELLAEHGCIARGVDGNRLMVEENRTRGLDVVEGDVVKYLMGLPDASVGMLTGFHIIEHLPFGVLVQILDECHRVLRPHGCVVFETPNPENLVVGAYTFYFDPTHRNPIPPQLAQFLLEHRGFEQVEILRLHPRADEGLDQALLDKWFRSATDYAVIGWKGGRSADAN